MSTINVGSALPAGSNNIGNVKVVDTGGTNQLAVDANNNAHVTIYNAANAMAVDSSNNGHVGVFNGSNQLAVNSGGNAAANLAQISGTNILTGTGAGGSGAQRVTVSNDSEIQLWDGTNGPVAVKAANTSPVLADKAITTAISPNNSGLPVNLPTTVQSTNAKSSGSVASLAKAFSSNNAQGNSIVVVCGVGNGTAPTISDTNSNTYTQAAQVANGTAFNVAVFYAVNIASGANTVTVNNGGSTASIAMEIYEVSGLLASIPNQPDQTATNTGSSGTASTSTISAMSPNELAFAAVGVGTAAQTITVGSGWTNDSGQQNPTTPAGLFSFVSMSQFLGSLKAVTPQATFTSEPWAIAVATFRPVILGVEGTTKITDGTVTMAFGQNTMANSMPVTVASNQSNLPINLVQVAGSSVATAATGIAKVGLTDGSGNTINSTSNALNVSAVQSGTWTEVPNAATSGGSTPSHTISASGTNATNLKNSAGQVYGFCISNSNASARFFKLYDKSSAPTVGTDTPKMTVQVPGSGTVIRAFPVGLAFANGISWALTTGIADSDTGSVGTDISVDIDYK